MRGSIPNTFSNKNAEKRKRRKTEPREGRKEGGERERESERKMMLDAEVGGLLSL